MSDNILDIAVPILVNLCMVSCLLSTSNIFNFSKLPSRNNLRFFGLGYFIDLLTLKQGGLHLSFEEVVLPVEYPKHLEFL